MIQRRAKPGRRGCGLGRRVGRGWRAPRRPNRDATSTMRSRRRDIGKSLIRWLLHDCGFRSVVSPSPHLSPGPGIKLWAGLCETRLNPG